MQLSPLQSRLVASLTATFCVVALYLLLSSPKGALAAELPRDSSLWMDLPIPDTGRTELQTSSYEPIFSLFTRSILGRAQDVTPLENNRPLGLNVGPGSQPVCYLVKKGSLGAGRDARKIYISANTCLQPTIKAGKKATSPGQLTLFVSNNTDAGCPQITSAGNGVEAKGFTSKVFTEGAVTFSINSTNDVYVAIYAPTLSDDFEGTYNFEIAASNTTYFHRYEASGGAELLWMDSDSTSALLVTRNLTDDVSNLRHVMSEDPPYQLYVSGKDTTSLDGMRRSACGFQKNALIGANNQGNAKNNAMVKTAMTLRGPGGLPKQQFYVVGLNATSAYSGVLVKPANVTVNSKRQVGGSDVPTNPGSIVFQATSFQTNAAPNCKVVTDLEFCDEIQYAVPGNDGKYNNTELAKAYDNYAKSMYDNFLKVMMQVQCETDRTSRYSLARTCDDCKNAYKRWLCTVSIPRCEDFQGESRFSVIRNVGQPFPNGTMLPTDVQTNLALVPSQNASRNAFIDTDIQPGPYREIMPCEDICYQVVQSCPSKIGFKCPQEGMYAFNVSYGKRDNDNSTVSCNYPGEARTPVNGAAAFIPNLMFLAVVLSSGLLLLG
ncbi:hypothetical protein H634G_06907 [Metarhizium anisopliae BRIP 53293]|uniref:Stretch-activated cation channel n=1 Tax=Metarhizium anisopliae BRIP 53293 TaxID=1291518 RepID=A0A0D9NZD3_METAN|nr:hypothetical protein H634G_06907 [Metarhizium anisopliae BRIP 53293]KJK93217.1 hypothetical protein H633G_02894 [Metarhizium anisopliae BRIP 53284]